MVLQHDIWSLEFSLPYKAMFEYIPNINPKAFYPRQKMSLSLLPIVVVVIATQQLKKNLCCRDVMIESISKLNRIKIFICAADFFMKSAWHSHGAAKEESEGVREEQAH